MEVKFTAQEVLQLAINLEEEGVIFYRQYAELAKGEIRDLMLQMAEDEKEHAKVFRGFYENLEKAPGDEDYLMSEHVQQYLASFSASVAFAREQKKPETLKEALTVAVETEQMTIDYYTSLLKYGNPELNAVLDRLIAEETKHRDRLKAMLAQAD